MAFTASIYAEEAPYYGTAPLGWHWGTETDENTDNKKTVQPKNATQELKIIQDALEEVKARAVLSPTPENVYTYLVFQNWVQEQSTRFASVAIDVVANNPQLNYELKNPTTSNIRQVQLQTQQQLHLLQLGI